MISLVLVLVLLSIATCNVHPGCCVVFSLLLRIVVSLEHDQVSCGAEFTAVIDNRGRLLTFGSPQDGQLGAGTTGEFIEKAGKISHDLVLTPSVVSLFISKVSTMVRS